MSNTELLRRQYDEMVSENARLTAALAAAEARAAAAEQARVIADLREARADQECSAAIDRIRELEAVLAAAEQRAEAAVAALAGMLESFDMLDGSEIALTPFSREVVRAAFITEIPRARAVLAAAAERQGAEGQPG